MKKHHGMRDTRTYSSWASMHDRCKRAPSYLARGTHVCERWADFRNFLADLGPRPEEATLDRIDPYGNYEPGNCRWATRTQQARNVCLRRANRSGIHGVWWYEARQVFKACINHAGKLLHLGYTSDFFEACCLRKSAENTFYHEGATQ